MAGCLSTCKKRVYHVCVVLTYILCYLFDVVLDIGIINRLCCHHAGDEWYQIVNPVYCGLSFSLTYVSSIVCNAVAFKEFLEETKRVSLRILLAILAIFQCLPFIWFIYCISLLSCDCHPSSTERLMMATYTVRMFEALVEGLGQMCLQSYMVMEAEQWHKGIGNLTFQACRDDDEQHNTILGTLGFMDPVDASDLVDNEVIYISILASLITVCYTIVKWVNHYMEDKGCLWTFGYTCITALTVGTRGYIQSTYGTFWKTHKLFINIYWLAPFLACTIASMIYACIRHDNKNGMKKFLKRSIAGTCDFLSPDGIPSTAAYFICSVAFNIKYYHLDSFHLQAGLALSGFVLLTNIVFSFIFPDPIFQKFFEDETPNSDNDRSNLADNIEMETFQRN